MTRRMAVSMTVDAVRAGVKTVTRRHPDSWKNLGPGDRLLLIEKGMGLRKGEKQVVICEVEVVSVRVEPLAVVTDHEVHLEGLADEAARDTQVRRGVISPAAWFCLFWKAGHGYKPNDNPNDVLVRRIEWRYLNRLIDVLAPAETELDRLAHDAGLLPADHHVTFDRTPLPYLEEP